MTGNNEIVMLEFNPIVFESANDIKRIARNLNRDLLSKEKPLRFRGMVPDLLPLIMYILGLAYYGIGLLDYLQQHNNQRKVSENKSQKLLIELVNTELVNGIADPDSIDENKSSEKFWNDAQLLEEGVKSKTFDLETSLNLDSTKEILSDNIQNIMSASQKNVNKDVIKYVVDHFIDDYYHRLN